MKEKICCEYCKKVFISQYLLEKHLNRKELCLFEMLNNVKNNIKMLKITMNKYDDNSLKSKLYICAYCKITYSNKGNVKRHITNNCDERNQYIVKLKTLDRELLRIEEKIKEYNKKLDNNNNNQADNQADNHIANQQDIQDLSNIQNMDKDEIIKLVYNLTKNNSNQPININITNINNNNTQNNTNNTNTINNTQNNTLNLNNFDNPNCDFLTDEQKNKFLKDRYKGLIDFITYVYFNESYPENHTILYTNLRSKFGHIYKNNKWIVEEIDNIADKLNDYSFDKLSEHLDDIKGDKDKAELFEKEIDKGEKFVEHFTSNDSTKQSRTNIKKLIYNNKDLVTKTKEKVQKKKVINI
jgi:hypothetical protein